MKSFVVAAALVIGAGSGSAFAGSWTEAARHGALFELAAHEDAASFDRGPGKPQDIAEPSFREDADEEVTGSLRAPDEGTDGMMDVRGKSGALRAPDGEESDEIGKTMQREEREAQLPADADEEFTGSIDRSADGIDKSQARGKAIGEGDEDPRAFGDEAGKPNAEFESE